MGKRLAGICVGLGMLKGGVPGHGVGAPPGPPNVETAAPRAIGGTGSPHPHPVAGPPQSINSRQADQSQVITT